MSRDEAAFLDDLFAEADGLPSQPRLDMERQEWEEMPPTPRERQEALLAELQGRVLTQAQLQFRLGWKWEFITSNMGILNQQKRVARRGLKGWTASS